MDFLDPKKLRRSRIMLGVGYVLIAIAILLATMILLYISYGFGFGKNGQIIQNGLLFVSSQPSGASIYTNGSLYKSKTNTRVLLPSGAYSIKISAPGYRDWTNTITIDGGDVQHLDYPFLFPTQLKTATVHSLAYRPSIVTQSPNRQWLLVETAADSASFLRYNLNNKNGGQPDTVTLPATVFHDTGNQSWQAVGWSGDNRYLLLLHNYTVPAGAAHEYVVLDTNSPDSSINITEKLSLSADQTVSLLYGKYNQYYIFDQKAGVLQTSSLDGSVTPEQLNNVLQFTQFGSDGLLYVTTQAPTGKIAPGKVNIVLQQDQKTITLRTEAASPAGYILKEAGYSGSQYVVVGEVGGKGVYVYQDPFIQTSQDPDGLPHPLRFIKISQPAYVSFSPNGRFVAVENASTFAVYDIKKTQEHDYDTKLKLDAPQAYAVWMDGYRLEYISGGKLIVFDFDGKNIQTLQAADPHYTPAFDPSYQFIYNLAPAPPLKQPQSSATPATPVPQLVLTDTPLTVKS